MTPPGKSSSATALASSTSPPGLFRKSSTTPASGPPGAFGGRPFDGRDDDARLVAEAPLAADPAELALRVGLEDPVVLFRQIRGVRVELRDHPLDGALNEPRAVDRVDVLVLDEDEHA